MAIEIVSFPINNMMIFHIHVNVYQGGSPGRAISRTLSGSGLRAPWVLADLWSFVEMFPLEESDSATYLPSRKLSHNYGKITIFNWDTHEFYGHVQ